MRVQLCKLCYDSCLHIDPRQILSFVRIHEQQEGSNPLSGWKPSVPEGQRLELGSEHYDGLEREGLDQVRRRSAFGATLAATEWVALL